MSRINRIIPENFLDFFYPKRCGGCGKAGTYFCGTCIKVAKLHFPQVCPVCERASVDGVTHKRCKKGRAPDGLFVIWAYEGAPRKLIGKLKYKFVSDLALSLASPATGTLKNWKRSRPEAPRWVETDFVLVPVPLHWWRGNWRGFNQAAKVGEMVARLMGWKIVPLLKRKKWTKTQVGLKAKERKENIEGAFTINPDILDTLDVPISSIPILLFDDVWTSGSTMREAARMLKKKGFRRVWCLTLAR